MEIVITKARRKFGWEIKDLGYCNFGHTHEMLILELRCFFNSELDAKSDAVRMLNLIKEGKI